ncbi:MAG TPA: hypothetical protein VN862_09070 [Candidatus Acidoferrales bacterium]|jgi:hypothetical protein|nr:hypothetical protein [Candidatus Acidoferrales bacterium]
MHLSELVAKYLALAGEFGRPIALETFGLSTRELEQLFGFLDEDYHISRYFHFTNASGTQYTISGEACTHVAIDAAIREIL